MVAIVSGNNLGLNLGSMASLGQRGQIGTAKQGQNGERAYVNASTGQLVLQDLDAGLMGLGPDVAALRTYNSQGLFDYDNNDGWQGATKSIAVTGAGLRRFDDDGSSCDFVWEANRQLYVATVSAGSAVDTIKTNEDGTYTFVDGATGVTETYQKAADGGRILTASDSSGNTCSYAYDAANRLIGVTDGSGESVNFVYGGASGNDLMEVRRTGLSGQVTKLVSYTYDALDRLYTVSVELDLLKTQPPKSGAPTQYTTTYLYDGSSKRVASATQADGTSLHFTYVQLPSGEHRVETVTDGEGNTSTFSYSPTTNTTTVVDALGVATVYQYDAQGRLTGVRSGVTAANPAGLSRVKYGYDDLGNVTSIVDGLGNVVTMVYDGSGNLLKQIDGAGNTLVCTYNAKNQVLTETVYGVPTQGAVAAARPSTTRYVYDSAGKNLLRFVVSPEGRVTEYRYDAKGQRTSSVDYAAATFGVSALSEVDVPTESAMQAWVATQDLTRTMRVDTAYDFRGELQAMTEYDEVDASGVGVASSASTKSYVYDPYGRLNVIIEADHTISFDYDGLGRILSRNEVLMMGALPRANVAITQYDDANGKMTVSLTSGLVTSSAFDKAGRLVSVMQSSAADGSLGTTRYTYDADGRLLMAKASTGGSTFMLWDASGRKVGDVDSVGRLTEYVYNASGQLTGSIQYATPVDLGKLVDANGNPTAGGNPNPGVGGVTLASIRPVATSRDARAWNLYDAAGRLVWQVDALGYATRTEYDGASQIVSVKRFATPVDVQKVDAGATLESQLNRYSTSVQLQGWVNGSGPNAERGFSAWVVSQAADVPSPSKGTVTFFAGSTVLGSAAVVNGWAMFAASNLPVGATSVTAVYSGDADDLGSSATVAIDPVVGAPVPEVVLTPAASTEAGSVVELKAAVTGNNPTGVVEFYSAGVPIGTAGLVNGVAVLRVSSLPLGHNSLTAVYLGDAANATSASAAVDQPIEKAVSSLYASQIAASVGSIATLTAVVSGANPTGTVAFSVGGVLLGTATVVDGIATLRASLPSAGSQVIMVDYSGDARNLASSGYGFATVLNSSSVSVTAQVGNRLGAVFTALVDVAEASGTANWGTVSFFNGTDLVGSAEVVPEQVIVGGGAVTRGRAVLTRTDPSIAPGGVTAVYSGNSETSSATSAPATSASALDGATPPLPGATLTLETTGVISRDGWLTVGVSGASPTGLVTFFDSSRRVLGVSSVHGGRASISNAGLPVGQVTLYATYSGDSTCGSSALVFSASVAPVTSSVFLSTSPANLAAQGTPVTLHAFVQGSNPTGTVSFVRGRTILGTVALVNGHAALTVADLPAGTDVVKAIYNGDENNESSGSPEVSVEVAATPVWAALSASAVSVEASEPLTLTARVTGNRPTGEVAFVCGGIVLGSATVVDGVAMLTVHGVDLPVGAVSITAVYAGDGINPSTKSQAVGVQVAAHAEKVLVGDSSDDRTTTTLYDRDGRLLGVIDGEGYLAEARYDAAGRQVETIQYATRAPNYLDASAFCVQVAAARAAASLAGLRPNVDAADIHTFSYYNARGLRVGEVDGEGYLTETVYDANGYAARVIRYAQAAKGSVDASSTLASLRPGSDPEDQVTENVWSATGQLEKQTRPDGTVEWNMYDSAGNLVVSQVTYGTDEKRTFCRQYDVRGHVTAELSAAGAELITGNETAAEREAIWQQYATRYTYDAAGRLTSSTDPAGTRTVYFYDEASRLRYTVNAAGEVNEQTYDVLISGEKAVGRLTGTTGFSQRLAASTVASLHGGLLSAAENQSAVAAFAAAKEGGKPSNRTTGYDYDARGELTKTTDALGGVSTAKYNAFGEVARATQMLDASRIRVDTSEYDRRGLRKFLFADAEGESISTYQKYDAFGRVTRSVDARGHGAGMSYDRLGRLVGTTDRSGQGRSTKYDAIGRVLTQTDALGKTTSYVYDTAKRSMVVTTPEGVAVTTVFAGDGQICSVTDGNKNKTSYYYDADGNFIRAECFLDGATVVRERRGYDAADRLTSTMDANGVLVSYSYDAVGRVLTRTVDPIDSHRPTALALRTEYKYDAFGEVVWTTDPRGIVTETTYDAKGEVFTQTVDPSDLKLVTKYEYDARGKVLTVTSPGGTVTRNSYDALGRLVQQVVDPGGLALTHNYFYDNNGNLVCVEDANHQLTRYVYDASDRLKYSVDAEGSVRKTEYDAEGRAVRTVAYYVRAIYLETTQAELDAAQIESVLAPGGEDEVVQHVYDRDGRLVCSVDGEGGVTRFEYDGNGNVIQRLTYATRIDLSKWNPDDGRPFVPPDHAQDVCVRTVYDALNRATFTIDGAGGLVSQKYDGNGNVVERIAYAKPVPSGTAVTAADLAAAGAKIADSTRDVHIRRIYDAANRLTWSVDGTGAVTQQTFDEDGNVTRRVAYATGIGDGDDPRTVSLDARDRAVVMAYDKAGRVVYSIDAMGAVARNVYDDNGNITQKHAYAVLLPLAHASGDVPDVAKIKEALSEVSAERMAHRSTSAVYNKANRLVLSVDATGAVARCEYDGAGRVIATTAFATRVTPGTVWSLEAVLPTSDDDRTTLQAYDRVGRLVHTVDPEGGLRSVWYDGMGRVASRTQHLGVFAEFSVGVTVDQIWSAVYAKGDANVRRIEWHGYDRVGNEVIAIDAAGGVEFSQFNGVGERTVRFDKLSGAWSYRYDAAGRLVEETSPAVSVARLHFSTGDFDPIVVTAATEDIAVRTGFEYDALGNLVSTTEAVGLPEQRITRYDYDAACRRVRTTYQEVGVYDAASDNPAANGQSGDAARIETPREVFSQVEYDAFGEIVASLDVSGNVSYKLYDAAGRVKYDIDAAGYVTRYKHSVYGDVEAVSRFAQSIGNGVPREADVEQALQGVAARTVTMEYDAAGRVVTVTQPETWVNNSNGKGGYLASGVVSNTFDAFGQVVEVRSLVDAQSNVWAAVTHYYDGRGLEVATVDAMGYLTSQEYDAAGNLTRRTEYASALDDWDATGHGAPAQRLEDREVSYGYDELNRKARETRSVLTNGARVTATTTYGYDAVGNVKRVTDAYGNSTYSFYDAMGRVTVVVAPPRVVRVVRVVGVVDGVQMAPATMFRRDALGEVVEEVQLEGGAKVSTDGKLGPVVESLLDRTTVKEYDAAGHVVRTIDACDTIRYLSYDAAGRLAKQWVTVGDYGPAGLISKHTIYSVFEYDRLGQQTAIVTPASNSVLLPNGLIRSVSQAAVGSVRTEMEYDAYGAMTKRTSSGVGATTTGAEFFEYDAAGRLWQTNGGDGNAKIYLYDLLGRQTSVITSAGSAMGAGSDVALSKYSSAQDVDQLDETQLRRTDIELDVLGRALKLTLPAREQKRFNQPNIRVRPMIFQSFDRWGNVLSRTDPTDASLVTEFGYDSNNQVLWEKAPEVWVRRATGVQEVVRPVTERGYDLLGRLIWTRDANGNLNSQKWNAGGQLETETHADTGVVTHSYNVFGEQVALKDAEGNVTYYGYDQMGRNVGVGWAEVDVAYLYPESMGVVTQKKSVWQRKTYDGVGRLIRDASGNSYRYDARGNIVAVTQPMGQVTYAAFDANGKQTASVDANGNTKTWSYDGFGHLLSKTDFVLDDSTPAGDAQAAVSGVIVRTDLTYDNAGQLIAESNSGGKQKSYAYDSAGQLRRVDDAALQQSARYWWDSAGRRIEESTSQAPSTATDGATVIQSQILRYDALGRLAYVSGLGGVELTFEYDAVGNRMHESVLYSVASSGSMQKELWFAYDVMNRQVLVDGAANGDKADKANLALGQGHFLTYDLNGNRKSDVHRGIVVKSDDPSQARNNIVEEDYSYDVMNRLTKVTATGYAPSVAAWAGVTTLEILDYDSASRVVRSGPQGALSKAWVDTYTAQASNAVSENTVVNLYDANGRLSKVRTDNPDDQLDSETVFEYDAAGNQLALTTRQGDVKTHTQYSYVELDGYKQKVIAGYLNDDVAKKGVTTSQYDANGYLIAIEETVRADTGKLDQSRTFVNDTNGEILLKRQVDKTGQARFLSELVVNGNVLAVYGVGIDPNMPADAKGDPRFIVQGSFDLNFEPITNASPGQGQASYSVGAGDTLSGIAQAVYGDSSLWYLIADANGLMGDSDLHVGMTVVVPNRAGGTHNSSDVFKPYDPSRIIGEVAPNLPGPPCNVVGIVLMVIAVAATAVATYFSCGAAAAALPAEVALLVGMAAGGAIGFVGGVATQGIAVLTHMQKDFDWSQVAIGSVVGAVGGGFGALGGALKLSGLAAYAFNAGSGMATNMVGQVMEMGFGKRKSFDPGFMVLSGFAAVATSALGQGVDRVWGTAAGSVMDVVKHAAIGASGAVLGDLIVQAHDREGFANMNWTGVVVDALGSALGAAVVSAIPAEEVFGKLESWRDKTFGVRVGGMPRIEESENRAPTIEEPAAPGELRSSAGGGGGRSPVGLVAEMSIGAVGSGDGGVEVVNYEEEDAIRPGERDPLAPGEEVLIKKEKFTGKEKSEDIRAKFGESGVFYSGDATWDSKQRTWFVETGQLLGAGESAGNGANALSSQMGTDGAGVEEVGQPIVWATRPSKAEKELAKLEALQKAADGEVAKLWTVSQFWQSTFNTGAVEGARTAARHRAEYVAAVGRAKGGEDIVAVHGPMGISTDVYYYDSSGHVVGTLESLGSYATATEIRRAEAVAAKDAVFGSVLGSLAYAGADWAGASLETKNKLANDVANLSELSFALPGVAARAKERPASFGAAEKVFGARGAVSGRPFELSAAGGPIRSLSTSGLRITTRGVDAVEAHVARFGPDEMNAGMIARLRQAASGDLQVTPYDLNFYAHELRESVRYRRLGFPTGDPGYELWNNAHTATLEDYGINELVRPHPLYHPTVGGQ